MTTPRSDKNAEQCGNCLEFVDFTKRGNYVTDSHCVHHKLIHVRANDGTGGWETHRWTQAQENEFKSGQNPRQYKVTYLPVARTNGGPGKCNQFTHKDNF